MEEEYIWRSFTVSDEGEGVLEADREWIFERSCRSVLSQIRDSGAADLGLSIAKLFVEQCRGRIGVQQSGVQGSSFWFTVRELADGVGKVIWLTT
jgi:K+-sensing histidine kinase KdpD